MWDYFHLLIILFSYFVNLLHINKNILCGLIQKHTIVNNSYMVLGKGWGNNKNCASLGIVTVLGGPLFACHATFGNLFSHLVNLFTHHTIFDNLLSLVSLFCCSVPFVWRVTQRCNRTYTTTTLPSHWCDPLIRSVSL